MTALDVFSYSGQQLRTVVVDGQPWFVAADVLAVLEVNRSSIALLDEDERGVHSVDTPSGPQQMSVISEAGLFSLILRSRKPEAKAFKRWVTHEVLPAIRRTGSYGVPQLDPMGNTEHLALILQAGHAALTRAVEAEARVAELEPRAFVAEKLLDADGDLSVADAAKALVRGGIATGPQRLFAELETRGWIFRAKGDNRWRVYQSAMESGVMSVLPQSHYHPQTGDLVLDPPQCRVTPKGVQTLLTTLLPSAPVRAAVGGQVTS